MTFATYHFRHRLKPNYQVWKLTIRPKKQMNRISKPIQITPELAARCDGTDQAERMDKLFRAVIAVPHSAVVKDTAKRKRKRAAHKDKL